MKMAQRYKIKWLWPTFPKCSKLFLISLTVFLSKTCLEEKKNKENCKLIPSFKMEVFLAGVLGLGAPGWRRRHSPPVPGRLPSSQATCMLAVSGRWRVLSHTTGKGNGCDYWDLAACPAPRGNIVLESSSETLWYSPSLLGECEVSKIFCLKTSNKQHLDKQE